MDVSLPLALSTRTEQCVAVPPLKFHLITIPICTNSWKITKYHLQGFPRVLPTQKTLLAFTGLLGHKMKVQAHSMNLILSFQAGNLHT